MASAAQADLVIVGAGVVGVSLAYWLSRHGMPPLLVDSEGIAAGASSGNCGLLSPSHAPPLAAPGVIGIALRSLVHADAPLRIAPTLDLRRWRWLARFAARCNAADYLESARAKAPLLNRSRSLIAQWIADAQIDCSFAPVGHLAVHAQPAPRLQALAELLGELGVEAKVLDDSQACALEPALKPGFAQALYTASDAHLDPVAYVHGLAAAAIKLGTAVRLASRLAAVEPRSDGVVLHFGTSTLLARRVVVALGAQTPLLGGDFAHLRIEPAKGYSLTIATPSAAPRMSVVHKQRGVAITPMGARLRIGSTYEFCGFDRSANPLRQAALVRGATELLRVAPAIEQAERWHGFRPMTPDGLPYLGALDRAQRVWVAAGHGTLGMSMSAASAELVGQQLLGHALTLDPAPYGALRH